MGDVAELNRQLESATKPNRNSSEQRNKGGLLRHLGVVRVWCGAFSSKHIVSDSLRRADPRGAFQVKSSVWC